MNEVVKANFPTRNLLLVNESPEMLKENHWSFENYHSATASHY